jgi:hypothetical protein
MQDHPIKKSMVIVALTNIPTVQRTLLNLSGTSAGNPLEVIRPAFHLVKNQ